MCRDGRHTHVKNDIRGLVSTVSYQKLTNMMGYFLEIFDY